MKLDSSWSRSGSDDTQQGPELNEEKKHLENSLRHELRTLNTPESVFATEIGKKCLREFARTSLGYIFFSSVCSHAMTMCLHAVDRHTHA